MDINLRTFFSQFQDLDWNDVGSWPSASKTSLLIITFITSCVLGWYFLLNDKINELDLIRQKEETLKVDYKKLLVKAVNLDKLKEQKQQVTDYVLNLEKQLPNKTEMDRLLSDINYAGISKGLQFEVFKPNADIVKQYYAEVPINLKISGNYHKIAAFAADLSALSRIVTLNNINLSIQPNQANSSNNQNTVSTSTNNGVMLGANSSSLPVNNSNTVLVMDALAKTFRYLEPEEITKNNDSKDNKESSK